MITLIQDSVFSCILPTSHPQLLCGGTCCYPLHTSYGNNAECFEEVIPLSLAALVAPFESPCTFASHAQALEGAVIHFWIAVWTSCTRSDSFICPYRPVLPDSQLLFSSTIHLMYKPDIWHFLLIHNSRDCCSKIWARLEGAKEICTLYAEELWDGKEIPGGASGRGSWISLFWNRVWRRFVTPTRMGKSQKKAIQWCKEK